MKAVIWGLMGFAVFLFFISIFISIFSRGFGAILFLTSLAMMGYVVYLGFRPGGILRKERVIDTWSVLLDEACVEDGRKRADDIFQDVSLFLATSEAPNLKIERADLAPSLMRGMLGDQRPFIILTDVTNYRLKPYQIYISARPYGINLSAEWQLTYKPTILLAILSLIPYVNIIPNALTDLDLFDQQDLRAYAANAHHCVIRAVAKLMLELNKDPATLDKKSSGFLGVT